MNGFEQGMAEELKVIQDLLVRRREELMAVWLTEASKPTQQSMGRMFALGAVDSAVYRLVRRASHGVADE